MLDYILIILRPIAAVGTIVSHKIKITFVFVFETPCNKPTRNQWKHGQNNCEI